MSSDKKPTDAATGAKASGESATKPEWADGLKQLYDAVVDEPLPDSFMDLLAQLDDGGGDGKQTPSAPEGGEG